MADASLDDFFAKKDKSKKKSKSKKVQMIDGELKVDEPLKKEKKKKDKEKSQTTSEAKDSNTIGLIVNPAEEEQWKEVEEEKEKDYSGLRIANLQISEKEETVEEEPEQQSDVEEDENGEVREKKDMGQQGPWKAQATQPSTSAAPAPVEEPPKKEETPKSTGKYIPPSQRAAMAAGGGGSSGPTVPSHVLAMRRKKNAPNLSSEEDFPTLGADPQPAFVDTDTRNFEKVQYGGRQVDDPTKQRQALSLGNKFSALQD